MTTNIRLRKSIDGNGIIVYGSCRYVLTVSVPALRKLLSGTVESIPFTKYPVRCELYALEL